MNAGNICFGAYEQNSCNFSPITLRTDLFGALCDTFPNTCHDKLFVCHRHKYVHCCHVFSSECLLKQQDTLVRCELTQLTRRHSSHIVDRSHLQRFGDDGKIHLKTSGRNKQSLKQLYDQNSNLFNHVGLKPADYQSTISEFLLQKNIDVRNESDVFNSAVHRTYDFFLTQSNLNDWEEHLNIICACFYEIFSNSSQVVDDFGSSEFKTTVKFIISLERSKKTKVAPPLFVEEAYVKRRKQKLIDLQRRKKQKLRWRKTELTL